MMREYRVEESWTRFRVARMNGLVPFCAISDDDVVLNVDRDKYLTVYNVKEDHRRDMKADGITAKRYPNFEALLNS
uniref:Putative ovule protein n=1 Tax=Solanum chacoense TaxID=4108 RepID=A0A0V0GM24_SOLCH